MEKCAVITCGNTEKHDHLYNFPRDVELRNLWIDKCGISPNYAINPLKICNYHFTVDDFEEDLANGYRKILKSNAVPTRNLPLGDIPPYHLIKEHVDTNEILEGKLIKLRRQHFELKQEIKTYNKNIKVKRKKCIMLKNKVDKLKCNSSVINTERNLLSKVFSDAQIRILMGKKKVYWADDDLAMAFSLRQMSSKECYLYLKRFLNLPLPALSCVQKWAASK